LKGYEINNETIAILPMAGKKSKVIEKANEYIIDKPPFDIIEESCIYFGSSYKGRHDGTKQLIGVTHKAPIIIEESKELVFFPTTSPLLAECGWFSLKEIKNYYRKRGGSVVELSNGYRVNLRLSYGSFDNQVLRAARLESVLRNRKDM